MIIVVDFGSQFSHLIARRIRQLGVYSEIVPWTAPLSRISAMSPEGVVLSGGPRSVYEAGAPSISHGIFEFGVPVLGICYGHQLIAKLVGGEVVSAGREYGKEVLSVRRSEGILKGLGVEERVWMSHGDSVISLPDGFSTMGSTEGCGIAAYQDEKRRIFGVQFHPEVQHTEKGMVVLENFLSICGARRGYSVKGLDLRLVEQVRALVGSSGVVMGVSGGVDSLVAAVIISRAVSNLHLVFVDNGLLRKREADYVKEMFSGLGFANFHSVDASGLFLDRLSGVSDPEEKRRVIGRAFVEVFEKKKSELEAYHPEIRFLGQGTIYPDRIESAQSSGSASVIKTHHNVGGLPDGMKLELVEPLRDLYKDEVRELGMALGIKRDFLLRHPFPGPGLAVRVVGEVSGERLAVLREADAVFIDGLVSSGYYDRVWQAFAALLPLKAVGVMGDSRAYGYVVSLRAVTSLDGMTADWARLPDWLLEKVANDIMRKVPGVTRVVYDISQKPPATIEYE